MATDEELVNKYKEMAKKYEPEDRIDVLFICESPPKPKKGKISYFYNEDNPGSDILFATIVNACFRDNPIYRKDAEKKRDFLRKLKKGHIFLIDAVEKPINHLKIKKRKEIMEDKAEDLLMRIKKLKIHSETKIILIKKSVFEMLHPQLKDKYKINKGPIGFPRWYRDEDVVNAIRKIIEDNLLNT